MIRTWGLFGLSGCVEQVRIGPLGKQRAFYPQFPTLAKQDGAGPGADCNTGHTIIDYSGYGTCNTLQAG